VPWWRPSPPGLWFALVGTGFTAVVTAAVAFGPWRRGALGPVGATAAVVAAIVGLDVLTGSSLQLNGAVGYSAAAGNRHPGLLAPGRQPVRGHRPRRPGRVHRGHPAGLGGGRADVRAPAVAAGDRRRRGRGRRHRRGIAVPRRRPRWRARAHGRRLRGRGHRE